MREEEHAADFTELDLPRVVNTASMDVVEAFYEPVLARAQMYKRGVGYFTTNWARSAARGLAALAANGGTARWLTSPQLSEADWEALQHGAEARDDAVLRDALADTISDLEHELTAEPRNAVAWMIADGLLEIRLAVPTGRLGGDYHDKVGIAYDGHGNRIAFHGSPNDSEQALQNYEAFTVDCDWLSARDAEGVDHQERRFDRLWNGEDDNVRVYSIPDGAADDIVQLRDASGRPYERPETVVEEAETADITLRDYQREAVDSWFANECRGVLQMATGTGKTFTALAGLEEYLDAHPEPVLVVIAVPQTHLATQWDEEMELFDLKQPHHVYGSENPAWRDTLSRATTNIELGIRDRGILLTTHKTLSSDEFREKLQNLDATTVLVADEVHHLGAEKSQLGLLDAYDARLGLSATPERHYAEEESDQLLRYFDGIVFEYSLGDAIPEFLTPYDYHPIIVQLNEEELAEYREYSKRLARVANQDEVDEEALQRLMMKRADIVKSAENKYAKLAQTLRDLGEDVDHLLVYTNPDQLNDVQRILNENGIVQHKFTYNEDNRTRAQLLSGFDDGEYEALVAMRCLDEGVDVPSTRQAILMSNSGNPMQFVQRRGRVLRQAPGKDKASIYDMIVVPTLNPDRELVQSEKNILQKELRRFEEFADNALNEHAARNTIERLRTVYEV
jgi:superfamily II DNA or RNA helicase